MIAAGLLAKKAVERGLEVPATVKTSLAPGSKVVLDYLQKAGLMPYLEKLKFHIVGLRLHHLHWKLRPAPSRSFKRNRRKKFGRRIGALRQSQL